MAILFWLIVLISGVLEAYTGKYQAVTLWAGKMIAPPESEPGLPRGFQAAITPPAQNVRNLVNYAAWMAILGLGTYLHWYLGAVGLLVYVMIHAAADRFMPQTVDHYLLSILHSINNREADYAKANDLLRAEAGKELGQLVKELYVEYRGKGVPVPDIRDAGKMPNGG